MEYDPRMQPVPKMTLQVRLVLGLFLKEEREGDGEMYLREVGIRTGLPPGTVGPILDRLTRAGWLADRYEDPVELRKRRPMRRYFQLTSDGMAVARQEAWEGNHV
jgi:DNA-binding PadR family transcriptional regulator